MTETIDRLNSDEWLSLELNELGRIVTGSTPPTVRKELYGGTFPLIKPTQLANCSVSMGETTLTDLGAQVADVAPEDSILVSCIGNLGKAGLTTRKVAFNQQINAIIPSDPSLAKWIFYAVQTSGFTEQMTKVSSATTIAIVNKGKFSKLTISLAPRKKREAIINGIETQLSRLEAGVTALKHAQANLKRYRAAVLKAACEGHLVPAEAELARGRNHTFETGDELLARILDHRREQWTGRGKYKEPGSPLDDESTFQGVLPEGWALATWDQVGLSQNGRPFPSSSYQDTGAKLLRPGNLNPNGHVVWTTANTRCLPDIYAQDNSDLVVRGNELVMNLTAQSLKDEFLGRICITDADEQCLLNQRLARLTPILILPKFALYVLKSWRFRRFVDGLNSGSLIQHMFTSQLARFVLLLPPLAEQERIVAEVERRLSVVDQLEAAVEANLRRAVRLRQAVLQDAFGHIS